MNTLLWDNKLHIYSTFKLRRKFLDWEMFSYGIVSYWSLVCQYLRYYDSGRSKLGDKDSETQ